MSKHLTDTIYTDNRGRQAYFAASNSTQGFFSRYEENFRNQASLLYIIKGGPGTGKSRLMWDMVGAAEKAGWQAELYYCSSDPRSLDAIFLRGSGGQSVIFLDGTAPHVMEARIPGAKEQLIDLGTFWDQKRLSAQKEDIARLMQQKGGCYAAAYRYLGAAGLCEQSVREMVLPAVERAALERTAERLLGSAVDKRCSHAAAHRSPRRIFTDALGMCGWAHLDTMEQIASRICVFFAHYGVEYLLLEALAKRGEAAGASMTISYHPFFPTRPDAILFEDSRVLFTTRELAIQDTADTTRYIRTLHMRHLLDPSTLRTDRTALRQAQKHRDGLILAAHDALIAAATPHFALEEIYGATMDFAAKESFSARLANDLFGT